MTCALFTELLRDSPSLILTNLRYCPNFADLLLNFKLS